MSNSAATTTENGSDRSDKVFNREIFISIPFHRTSLVGRRRIRYICQLCKFTKFRSLVKLQRTETESIGESNVCGEFVKKFLPTLPRTFKSLLDTPISVENDEPRELIKSETLINRTTFDKSKYTRRFLSADY